MTGLSLDRFSFGNRQDLSQSMYISHPPPNLRHQWRRCRPPVVFSKRRGACWLKQVLTFWVIFPCVFCSPITRGLAYVRENVDIYRGIIVNFSLFWYRTEALRITLTEGASSIKHRKGSLHGGHFNIQGRASVLLMLLMLVTLFMLLVLLVLLMLLMLLVLLVWLIINWCYWFY